MVDDRRKKVVTLHTFRKILDDNDEDKPVGLVISILNNAGFTGSNAVAEFHENVKGKQTFDKFVTKSGMNGNRFKDGWMDYVASMREKIRTQKFGGLNPEQRKGWSVIDYPYDSEDDNPDDPLPSEAPRVDCIRTRAQTRSPSPTRIPDKGPMDILFDQYSNYMYLENPSTGRPNNCCQAVVVRLNRLLRHCKKKKLAGGPYCRSHECITRNPAVQTCC
jgi:hypothetical protein